MVIGKLSVKLSDAPINTAHADKLYNTINLQTDAALPPAYSTVCINWYCPSTFMPTLQLKSSAGSAINLLWTVRHLKIRHWAMSCILHVL